MGVATVAGAAVVLWTATPPLIPETNDNPAQPLSERQDCGKLVLCMLTTFSRERADAGLLTYRI